MPLKATVATLLQALIKLCHYFSAFILYPFMVLIITVDVGGRFLFNSPLSWGTEGSGLVQIMAIFLACAAVDASDAHIRLDILYENFKPRTQTLVNLLTCVVAGIWVGILTSRSFTEIFVSYDMLESGMDVTIPFWPIRVVMTFAFLLLALQLLMSFFINLVKLFGPEEGGEHA